VLCSITEAGWIGAGFHNIRDPLHLYFDSGTVRRAVRPWLDPDRYRAAIVRSGDTAIPCQTASTIDSGQVFGMEPFCQGYSVQRPDEYVDGCVQVAKDRLSRPITADCLRLYS